MALTSRQAEVARRLASALQKTLAGELTDKELSRGLRKLAAWVDSDLKLEPKSEARESDPRVPALFAWWQQKMGKPQAKLTPERSRAIAARLREGYSEHQIKVAIAACSSSDHHMGKNDSKTEYNDLTLICRNGSKLEWFMEMGKDAGGGEVTDIQTQRLQRALAAALQEERHEDYARINAELANHRAGARVGDGRADRVGRNHAGGEGRDRAKRAATPADAGAGPRTTGGDHSHR